MKRRYKTENTKGTSDPGVCNLENREKKLILENEEQREILAKYENSMKEGLEVTNKEDENLKDVVNNEGQRVREKVLGDMKAWKAKNDKAIKEVIDQQMKED